MSTGTGLPRQPDRQEVLSARDRLAASATFARSKRLIRLLEFTIDAALAGRGDEIKESTIGSEVYDRGADFDPRADGIVRVEASRLRQKLAEYYRGAGETDTVRIDYPKGSYVPTFRFAAVVEPSVEAPVATPITALAVLCCLAAGAVYWARFANRGFSVRRGVVVLSPVNLSGNQADAWLSPALRELLGAELSAGGSLRIPPGELVARAERNLSPRPSAGLAPDTFSDLARTLNVDTVLTGSYVIAGEPGNRQIRVDLHVQAGPGSDSGEGISESGSPDRLLELANRLGLQLRKRLGVAQVAPSVVASRGLPSASPAAPLYYSGIERMQAYDPLGALEFLDRAIESDPREPMSHLARAQCLQLLGRDPEAREAVARAFDLRGSLAREQQLRVEAAYYRLQPSLDRAVEVLRALVTFYPDELDYRFLLNDALNEAGRYRESVAEIAAMRALPAPLNQDPRIDWADMKLAHKQTDFPRRLSSARALEAKARGLHADWLVAEALLREAAPLARANQQPQAYGALMQARDICQRLGDKECVAFSWRNEGTILVGTGDPRKALEAFSEELAIGREIGSVTETGNALNGIGVVRQILGDLPGARDALLEVLALTTRNQDQFGIKMETLNLASVLLSLGDLDGAAKRYESALDLSRKIGESEGEAESLVGAGNVQLLRGRSAQAIVRYTEAAAVARRAGNLYSLTGATDAIANAYLASHRPDLARPAALEAGRLAQKTGNVDDQIEAHLTAARLAMEEKRFADGEAEVRVTKPLADKNQNVDQSTRLATLAVELALAQHRQGSMEIGPLKNIPEGTPKASALEARLILGRATGREATVTAALAEAHRLGLVLAETGAGLAADAAAPGYRTHLSRNGN